MDVKFYTDNLHKVICVGRFNRKIIRGIAYCHENDKFDYEVGKEIAKAKFDMKIAKLNYLREWNNRKIALDIFTEYDNNFNKAQIELEKARERLDIVLDKY